MFSVCPLCAPVSDPKGPFDFFTERQLQRNGESELQQLKLHAIDAYEIDQLARNQANEEEDSSRGAAKKIPEVETKSADQESVKKAEEGSEFLQHLDGVLDEEVDLNLRVREHLGSISGMSERWFRRVLRVSSMLLASLLDPRARKI
jgi:hypothetical protein